MNEKTITLANIFLFAFAAKLGTKTCDLVWDKYLVNLFNKKVDKTK